MEIQIETNRLYLRNWRKSDIDIMAAISSSPKVMEFFPQLSTYDDTLALISRIKNHFEKHGFGLYAVERKDSNEFIGFVGLNEVSFSIPSLNYLNKNPIEIGWRLGERHWGHGFAAEAANMVLEAAFENFHLDVVVSFTAKLNKRSIRVMEKIGMTHNVQEDFLHPTLADDSPLKPHVLYKMSKEEYLSR